jgi:acetyl coenzyme A synthetase (ADP forming)-like protein
MAEYPTEFEFDVLLKNGQAIHIRPIRPDDADREHRFFQRVGPESIYHRFFGMKLDLSPEELRHFTTLDYDDRMALIATVGDEMVAVGRYDVLDERSTEDTKVAEVAFLVEDAYQGLGIGRHLLQHLTVYARTRGITEFEAFVLAENVGMMRLFRNSGYRLTRQLDEGIFQVEFPIEYSIQAREAEWEHEKRAVTASIMPLLYPTSVAVIGASRNPKSIGGRLFKNILMGDFTGTLYPVNPSAPFVHSIAAYPSVTDIPGPVDLAVIVVPSQHVKQAIDECGRKGVKGIVVISAGFSEVGEAALEQEIVTSARRYGMRLVGPNCMGVLNTDASISLDAQFGPTFPPHGNVAMLSQSGALGLAILEQAADLGIGISTFVSLGNRADISANDLLLYWEDDPATDVVLLYMESFGNPRRFGRIARRVSKQKPVVVVKAGRSKAGARAAASHTGSLASLDVAVDALFRRSGVIRTNTLHQLFEVTTLLANQPLPAGRRVAVLTNAGGPGILAADAIEGQDLELPVFSEELQGRLGQHLSGMAAAANPVDMIASAGPEEYGACLDVLLDSDEIDAVIAIYIPTAPEGTEEIVAAIRRAVAEADNDKTAIGVFMGSSARVEEGAEGSRLPVFPYPESAARALASAVQYREWREREEGEYPSFDNVDRTKAEAALRKALRRVGTEGGWLDSSEISTILGAYGIAAARERVVHSEDEAVAAGEEIGGPLAIKVIAPSALHKSDVGGVALGVIGEQAIRDAYRQVINAVDDVEGVLIQEFVGEGHEVIVGMTEDPLFGPLIVFGLGGIFVELMQDVSFRINPLTDVDAREMLSEVRSGKLLEGYRGEAGGDLEAIEQLLLRLSLLVEHITEIAEIDLNPVKVLPPGKGAVVVDARIKVRPVKGVFLPSRKDIPGRML